VIFPLMISQSNLTYNGDLLQQIVTDKEISMKIRIQNLENINYS